jgi:predicted transposase YbfD/YdcC
MAFIEHVDAIQDTRKDINKTHQLTDIVFLTMAAVLSGASGWKDIQVFGEAKLDWLRQFRPFASGIPTRHSIGRIIRGISAELLMESIAVWINKQRSNNKKEHIAFDGKTVRGSGHNRHIDAVHLMGAMVVDSGLMLYQSTSEGKKNEIKTLQAMLETVPVKGNIISADAMHCQKETAALAREKGGDYMLQVKGNQKNLHDQISGYFHKVSRHTPALIKANQISDIDGEHGRIVQRQYTSLPIEQWIDGIDEWMGASHIVEVVLTHELDGKNNTKETSYYLTSLGNDLSEIARVIRGHWQIESYHWVLNVTFREDDSLIYAEDGAKNMAIFKRMLVNLVKVHPLKDSMAGKRHGSAWDDKFRAEVLFVWIKSIIPP